VAKVTKLLIQQIERGPLKLIIFLYICL